MILVSVLLFFSSRRRHTRCALVTGVQTCALPICSTPAMLGNGDVKGLVADLADELAAYDEALSLKERLDHVAATMACHGSVRAGRVLSVAEMHALFGEMAITPHSGHGNHGRPPWVKLGHGEIEQLYGRKEQQ